jgi:hypothetical protein
MRCYVLLLLDEHLVLYITYLNMRCAGVAESEGVLVPSVL